MYCRLAIHANHSPTIVRDFPLGAWQFNCAVFFFLPQNCGQTMTTLFFSQIAGEGRTRITAMKQLSICVVDVDRYFKCL